MAFDGYFCVAAAAEINEYAGARVDKLCQGSPSSFYLSLYKDGSRRTLVISASASAPIVAATDGDTPCRDVPSSLCMLFRKHLVSSRLFSAEAVKGERIIKLVFDGTDDMGYPKKSIIYAEMMGKYSNILLCSEDDRILGATHLSDITEGTRPVMIGAQYSLPPAQNKLDLAAVSTDDFIALCKQNSAKKCDKFLLATFACLSPLTAREITFRACGDVDAVLFDINLARLDEQRLCFVQDIAAKRFVPCSFGQKEYSFTPITQYGEYSTFGSFSELLGSFYGEKAREAALVSRARDIIRTVEGLLARENKKMLKQSSELEACGEKDSLSREGDVITANIYRIAKGDETLTAIDYETGETVTIELDKRKTPAQNAQARYKKYAKLKRAEAELTKQIAEAKKEIDYLEGVLDFIRRASSAADLDEIRRELAETGYMGKVDKRKGIRLPPSKPLTFVTSGGYTVKVGKNNKQNDMITFGAQKDDIWFHIKGFHGSHVVMLAAGEEPDARDYTEAAMLAAYHSEARHSRQTPVDYTRVRYVKKPPSSAPGFVTYDKYYTAYVDAEMPMEVKEK